MARRMVTEFGMSDAIGPVAVGERERQIFLGRDVTQRIEVSEKTAETVDAEVHRIIGEAYEKAKVILNEQTEILHKMAAALLDRETLNREEVQLLKVGDELPPKAPPHESDDEKVDDDSAKLKPKPQSDGGMLASPGAEPAGA